MNPSWFLYSRGHRCASPGPHAHTHIYGPHAHTHTHTHNARLRYLCPVSWTTRCTAEAPRRLCCPCIAYMDCMDARDHGVIHVHQDIRVLPAGAWERGGADAGCSSLGPLDCVPPCPSAVQTSVEQDSDMRRPQAALLVMMAGSFDVLARRRPGPYQ